MQSMDRTLETFKGATRWLFPQIGCAIESHDKTQHWWCDDLAKDSMQASDFEVRMFVAGMCPEGHDWRFQSECFRRYSMDVTDRRFVCRRHPKHPVYRIEVM